MDFVPLQITYQDLLKIFWESHDPDYPALRQYRSVIFYHDDSQKRLALDSKEREERDRRKKLYTGIVPFSGFYLAEDYHQKFRLRREPDIMEEFRAIYPREEDIVNSTAAARTNGYLAGYGTYQDLLQELSSLGLSEKAGNRLLQIVRTYRQSEWKTPYQIR